MFFKKAFVATAAVVGFAAASMGMAQAEQQFITIGTGGVTGVYYPTGGSICRLVNKGRKAHGIRCSVESTGGSAYNINTIRAGELDMGVAQSDVQSAAWNGILGFKEGGKFKELRSVFSVHAEPLQLIVRADSGITSFEGVKGKRVNLGNHGSGQRETMKLIMAHLGWTDKDFALAGDLKSSEQSKALCDNKLDAVFFTAGIPSGSVKEATTSCDTKIISMDGPWVDTFVKKYPAYAKAMIPGGTYRGTDADVNTFGPKATFVSSTATSADTVYQVVKAVFENFDDFKKLHPAFKPVTKAGMAMDGLAAPLHDGAMKYYKEAGIIK